MRCWISTSLPKSSFRRSRFFAVNVLASHQRAISNRFARPAADKFEEVEWRPGLGGCPTFPGCLALFECRLERTFEAGDHVVFMSTGRMVYFGPPTEALSFFGVTTGDFADIYTKLEGKVDGNNSIVRTDLGNEYQLWKSQNPQAGDEVWLSQLWELKYRRSQLYQKYVVDRLAKAPVTPAAGGQTDAQRRGANAKASPLRQRR